MKLFYFMEYRQNTVCTTPSSIVFYDIPLNILFSIYYRIINNWKFVRPLQCSRFNITFIRRYWSVLSVFRGTHRWRDITLILIPFCFSNTYVLRLMAYSCTRWHGTVHIRRKRYCEKGRRGEFIFVSVRNDKSELTKNDSERSLV